MPWMTAIASNLSKNRPVKQKQPLKNRPSITRNLSKTAHQSQATAGLFVQATAGLFVQLLSGVPSRWFHEADMRRLGGAADPQQSLSFQIQGKPQ